MARSNDTVYVINTQSGKLKGTMTALALVALLAGEHGFGEANAQAAARSIQNGGSVVLSPPSTVTGTIVNIDRAREFDLAGVNAAEAPAPAPAPVPAPVQVNAAATVVPPTHVLVQRDALESVQRQLANLLA